MAPLRDAVRLVDREDREARAGGDPVEQRPSGVEGEALGRDVDEVDAGIDASVGATGSSYDNALAETINGLYNTELIPPRGPWRTLEQVEIATLEWVDWFNHRRITQHCDDLTPAEFEQAYYRRTETRQPAEYSQA